MRSFNSAICCFKQDKFFSQILMSLLSTLNLAVIVLAMSEPLTVEPQAFLTTSSSSFSFRFFSKRYFSAFLAAFFCAAFFWGLAFIAAVLLSWLQILPDLYCRRGNPCLELAHRILTRKMVCPMYSFLNMECPLSLIS